MYTLKIFILKHFSFVQKMDFTSATQSIHKAIAADAKFHEECAVQEEELKNDLESVLSMLKTVLTNGSDEMYQLVDGSFLHLKETMSARTLNIERISSAIDKLSEAQIMRVTKELKEEKLNASNLAVLCACIEENLEDECVVVTETPTIVKRRPVGPTKIKIASESVEKAAERFHAIKEQLAILRSHKTKGKKVMNTIKSTCEPILHEYLKENHLDLQYVECKGGERPKSPSASYTKVLPSLPPVPEEVKELAHHQEQQQQQQEPEQEQKQPVNADEPPRKRVALTPLVVEGASESRVLEVERKVYTSRGKAPPLKAFIEKLPEMLAPLDAADFTCIETKRIILQKLLDEFTTMFNASKGTKVEKILVKPKN